MCFYTSVIRTVLEYAWHSSLTTGQSDMLESLQKRALRIIYSDMDLDYHTLLFLAELDTVCSRGEHIPQRFFINGTLTAVHPVLTIYYQNNVTLFGLLNCVAQTNTNLLELELNDFETPVSRTVYLISVANSYSRCAFDYIFMFLFSNLYFIVIV